MVVKLLTDGYEVWLLVIGPIVHYLHNQYFVKCILSLNYDAYQSNRRFPIPN